MARPQSVLCSEVLLYTTKCLNLTQSGSLSSLAFRSCAFPSQVNWLPLRLEVKKETTEMSQMLTTLINVNMEKEDNIIMISVTF